MQRAVRTFVSLFFCGVWLGGCVTKPFTNQELIDVLTQKDFEAREIDRGVVVVLPATVLFAFGSADLTPEARHKIDDIAAVLTDLRALRRGLAIEGHADAIGTTETNLTLSQQRADAVAQELIANRVRRDRLRSQGFGEAYPVAPNTNADGSDNPEGRTKNRRVEVVISN